MSKMSISGSGEGGGFGGGSGGAGDYQPGYACLSRHFF